MQRLTFPARPHWRDRLSRMGVTWFDAVPEHPVPYWTETAAYALTSAQLRTLQTASQELTNLVLAATGHAIEHRRLTELGIPAWLHDAVQASWNRDDPSVYLRLDLAYSGEGQPKLLEVNGQTPTSLIEAAVCQWHWLEDQQACGALSPDASQWNTIHEGLGEQWQHLVRARGLEQVTFSSARNDEDHATVTYLRDLAQTAGVRTSQLFTEDLGTSPSHDHLLDGWNFPIRHLMWLWPLEFAWESRDAPFLATTHTRLIEPLWKAVSSSKGLLALLHELYAGHELLLPATLSAGTLKAPGVLKPLFSREGQNVTLPGQPSTPGEYGDLPTVEQAYMPLPEFLAEDGTPRYPVLGVWAAGSEVCGLGIREGRGRVTDNRASFIPHFTWP